MKPDCVKSLELLSDYHDGALTDAERTLVRTHLSKCPPCAGIFRDLDSIVVAAMSLRLGQGVNFPDEDAIWQRMAISKRTTIH